uniref:non-specific serine/threonine protein kinase n=1 Tax=Brassica campestris TaxID=3711 RepID=M4CPI4_BRACM
MPKMKHLLRKLHTGGSSSNGFGDQHHRLDDSTRPMIDPTSIRSSSPSPASTSSVSSSSGFGNAAATLPRLETFEPAGRDLAAAVDGIDFGLMEEEYQVQLAMAISVSDPDPRENADTAQLDAAKRISLGVKAPVTNADSAVDFLSLRYWGHKVINYDQKVRDGFYDVYGVTSNSLSQGKMPLLVDLQGISVSDDVDYEVVLVNRLIDPELQELERRASALSLECPDFAHGQVSSDLTQKIADIVVEQMGGPVENADEALRRWKHRSYELRNALNTTVIPLGRVNFGLARHRALLFKVLADRIDLPCMLVKGSYYTGTDDGAVNLIKLDDQSEYIIDLMGAPGALIPSEVPSSFLPVSGTDTRVFPDDLDTLQHSCPVPEKEIETPAFSVLEETDSRYSGIVANLFNGSHEENSDRCAVEKHQTERFEHDFGKLMQSQQISGENLPPFSGKPTCAQKVKVKNVSKYVISAAKNPEFAQKLHAVLLESGASPPPDLFMDVNPQNLREKSLLQELWQESSNSINSAVPRNPEKVGDQLAEQMRESDRNPTALQLSAVCTSGEVDFSMKKNFEVDNMGKVSSPEKMEIGTADGEPSVCDSHDQGINPFLGEAAKWEIMWEDLQIGQRIGIGSYGEVYRAEWNGTEVAVKKFLDQDFSGDALTQFRSEIEIMLRLRHPNVVLFMGAVTRPPNFSILTEFLPRGSLYRLLHRPNHQLDEKRRMRMALDVAKGMNYLHTSHPTVVHRDLKSPNLLVDKNWVVKVCDFGLSRMKHHTYLSSKSTAGTPEWMAPEVLRNEPANEKCDVYSFGVILWELATSRIPWKGLNPMQVVGAVGFQNRRLEITDDIDPTVAQIIRDCWQTEPHLRPSFTQLMRSLKRLQGLNISNRGNTSESLIYNESEKKDDDMTFKGNGDRYPNGPITSGPTWRNPKVIDSWKRPPRVTSFSMRGRVFPSSTSRLHVSQDRLSTTESRHRRRSNLRNTGANQASIAPLVITAIIFWVLKTERINRRGEISSVVTVNRITQRKPSHASYPFHRRASLSSDENITEQHI